jgi:hypothetical protein
MKLSLLSLSLLFVITAHARADVAPPGEPPAQPGLPQALSPSNAVTMEMQKPAETVNKDNYNLRFYPFDLFKGGMRIDFLNRSEGSWAIGPALETINEDFVVTKLHYWGAGVTSTYGFGRPAFSHGWYLSPELMYRSGTVAIDDIIFSKIEADFRLLTAAVTAGYHWYWKSFNLALGLGGSYNYIQVYNAHGTFTDLFGASGQTITSGDTASASAFAITADFIMGFTF